MQTLYFKRLDTLRFIAFFLVFWSHAFARSVQFPDLIDPRHLDALTRSGEIGVHIFFVLSGFLITFLLLKEYHSTQGINILKFYIRRILRIWPLYFLILIPGIFILPKVNDIFHFCGNATLDLTFLNNFDMNTDCEDSNIGIAWSVAVEEQFYLFWPLIFRLLIPKPKILLAFCALIYAYSNYFVITHPTTSYFTSLGNLNYLMTGCMGAMAYFYYTTNFHNSAWMHPKIIYIVSLLTTGFILYQPVGSLVVLQILYLYIILLLVINNQAEQPASFFSRLGKYTYGMYMYHPITILIIKIIFNTYGLDHQGHKGINLAMACLALILSIVVSIASYELFEKRILKYKDKLAVIKTRL